LTGALGMVRYVSDPTPQEQDMRRRYVEWIVWCCCMAALPCMAFAQAKKVDDCPPTQLMQVQRITGVQVSPDGKRVVYAVRHAVIEDGKSEYRSHIHIANADGSGAIQLTHGDKSCDDPQWFPQGQALAFASARSGKRNVWMIPATGGEAKQATDSKTGITSYRISPNNVAIAYTATDGLTPAEEKAKKDKNDARVVDENIKMSRLYVTWLADARGLNETLLSKGHYNVSATGRAGYDWSPDSKSIVYACTLTPHADDWPSSDLHIVNAQTGSTTMLVNTRAAEYAPHYSPDGKSIAYVASDDPPTWAGTGRVHVVPANGGKPRALADTFDGFGRFSEIIGWSSDNQSLYFTEMKRTVLQVGRLPLDGPPTELGPTAGVAIGGVHLNTTGTHLGFSYETLGQPPEAHLSGVGQLKPIQVSHVNAKLPAMPIGPTEVVRWKSKDGLDIEGLLTYPANYEKGKRYPLLLNIHGGPMGVFTQSYVASPGLYPIATFSARGYAVLRPNPRGSSGYGKKFRYANYNDWGGKDYEDVITGVDHVIKIGVADETRLGVMGWSYGGFMTSWTITQTQRFKAASVGAGVTNLMSFTGTADIPSFLPDYFGGEFWDKPDTYRKHSAMFNIKAVRTPTLIQHGERDERVPLSQGLELYNALKRQGCATKMVIYPRTPHGIEEPRLLLDCMERNLEWFDRYLR